MKLFLTSSTSGILVHIQLQVSENLFFYFFAEEKNTFFSACSRVLSKEKKSHCFFLLMIFLKSDFLYKKLSNHGRIDNHKTRSWSAKICQHPVNRKGSCREKKGPIFSVLASSLIS